MAVREYTDILEAERDPARYQKAGWKVRIDGIEGHRPYLTPVHEYLYDEIYVGDAAAILNTLGRYDLIFFGDIIEHFEKAAGMALLKQALEHAGKAVLLSTPKYETAQDDLCGNELERHRSLWTARNFRTFPDAQVKTVDGATLVALLPRPGLRRIHLAPPRAKGREDLLNFQRTREQLCKLIPADAPFILVDEDQLRHSLPHQHAFPFLEQNGVYWGPPADDATAIRECERLRQQGARFIVFIASSFWWLEFYPYFEQHLRSRYRSLVTSDLIRVFDLSS